MNRQEKINLLRSIEAGRKCFRSLLREPIFKQIIGVGENRYYIDDQQVDITKFQEESSKYKKALKFNITIV